MAIERVCSTHGPLKIHLFQHNPKKSLQQPMIIQ